MPPQPLKKSGSCTPEGGCATFIQTVQLKFGEVFQDLQADALGFFRVELGGEQVVPANTGDELDPVLGSCCDDRIIFGSNVIRVYEIDE